MIFQSHSSSDLSLDWSKAPVNTEDSCFSVGRILLYKERKFTLRIELPFFKR